MAGESVYRDVFAMHTDVWQLVAAAVAPLPGETVWEWQLRVEALFGDVTAAADALIDDGVGAAGVFGASVAVKAAAAAADNTRAEVAAARGTQNALERPVPPVTGATLAAAPVRELAAEMAAVRAQLKRSVATQWRQIVAEAVVGVRDGSRSLHAAVWEGVDTAQRRGLTAFRDRRGRKYQPETYVDMATRTAVVRARVAGVVQGVQDAGEKFVQVSESPDECPLCSRWEGKILVVAGDVSPPAVGSLAEARGAGLFHPRCTHMVRPFLPGVSSKPPAPTPNPEGYAETQRQRLLERRIRQRKRELAVAKVGAPAEGVARAQANLTRAYQAHRSFLAATGRIARRGATRTTP